MSFESGECLRYVGPFSESPAPPRVILGDRMKLGQVICNQAHRGRSETRELLLVPIVWAAAMVSRELGQKAHRAGGLVCHVFQIAIFQKPAHLVAIAVDDDHLTASSGDAWNPNCKYR